MKYGQDDLYCLFYSLEEKIDLMLDVVTKGELEQWCLALVQMGETGKVEESTVVILKKLNGRLDLEWLRRYGRVCCG